MTTTMSDEVTELHNDLLRRAEACEELADACERNASEGNPCAHSDAATARRRGKAAAYRHAAELLRASPLAATAEVERLRAEVNALDAAAIEARDEADDARRARDAAEDALRGVWHEVAPDGGGFPRVREGDDEVADGATIAARAASLRAERDAAESAREDLRDRVAEEIGLRLDGHGDDDIAAEAGEVRRDRDALRSLLAAAARGELPRCDECHGGVLATLYAATPAGEFWRCDAHAGADEWETLPHAAALRAAIGGAK